MMRNRAEFLQLQAAIARMGGAAVSVSWRSTPSELEYLASHCGARFIAFEHDLFPTVEHANRTLGLSKERLMSVGGKIHGTVSFDDLASERAPKHLSSDEEDEDAAVVVYTSGTTGKPKGAVRKFPKDTF